MSHVRIMSPRPEIINHFYLVFIKPLVKNWCFFFAKSVFCGAKNKLAKDDQKMRKAVVIHGFNRMRHRKPWGIFKNARYVIFRMQNPPKFQI